MDLFRSKKRDVDQASLEVGAGLQKKHHGLSSSLDDLLAIAKDDTECLGTASENTASESDDEDRDINKANKRQKAFAKISIKREKRKEKEQRRKTEKNQISMDDFLGKQTEFKMWLYEEKSKNAGEMASPKLKTHFKQFVRLWNKKKLASKYYRCSTLPESPAPLTPRKCNFLFEEDTGATSPLLTGQENVLLEKDTPTSPFVTFGKTPPKVLRSKKFQLFGSSNEVALISVAPIGSPQDTRLNNENVSKEQYHIPKIEKKKEGSINNKTKMPRGATPYKVSVFPWASTEVDCDLNQSLDICSTDTPPSMSHQTIEEDETWPSPPSESELLGDYSARTNDSPLLPPPPPPRLESLQKIDGVTKSPKLAANYADPYDKLPGRQSSSETQSSKRQIYSHYQDPVDCVPAVNHRKVPDNARLLLQTMSQNEEPDQSLYSKPVTEKRLSKEELEELYAKPLKRAKKNDIGSLNEHKETHEAQSDLYNEIMKHINKSISEENDIVAACKPDPDYETIDECMAKIESEKDKQQNVLQIVENETKNTFDLPQKRMTCSSPKFATISKSKKKRVMAASTEKIYETYLSLGRNANPFKTKIDLPKPPTEFTAGSFTQSLKLKCKSQPDICFSEELQAYDIDTNLNKHGVHKSSGPLMSSFKPDKSERNVQNNFTNVQLKESDRAKSYEDGLRNDEEPRTPIIMATPSFESLFDVTPLSCKSFSSQSLPGKSASYESLSSQVSTSTASSLSFGPDEKSCSLQSLQSDKSLSPVKEEDEYDQSLVLRKEEKREKKQKNFDKRKENLLQCVEQGVISENQEKDSKEKQPNDCDPMNEEVYKKGIIPLTPGKISALKHGIDLSVYLLKPTKQDNNDKENVSGKEYAETSDTDVGKSQRSVEPHCHQKLFDAQSRLAIKDTLSAVRTKVDHGAKKDIERRHTVQTVQEISKDLNQKKVNIPNIDVTSKARTESVKSGNSKFVEGVNADTESAFEPDMKRHCGEKKRMFSVGDQYLETDLDKVLTDKARRPMKKSKSHSGFDTVSNTVVTDIW